MRNFLAITIGTIVMLFICIGTYVIAIESIRINRMYNVKEVITNSTSSTKTVSIYE